MSTPSPNTQHESEAPQAAASGSGTEADPSTEPVDQPGGVWRRLATQATQIDRRVLVTVVAFVFVAAVLVRWAASPTAPWGPAADVPDPDTRGMPESTVEMIESARQVVIDAPDSPGAWLNYGMHLDAHQLYDEAETSYRRAAELAPEDPRPLYYLAIVQELSGAPPEDVAALFRQVEQMGAGGYPPLQVRLGDAFAEAGQAQEAHAAYQQALALDPNYPIAHRQLAGLFLALGQPQRAIEHLETVIDLQDDDRQTYVLLSRAYQQLGREDQAQQAATRASDLEDTLSRRDMFREQVFRVTLEARTADMAARTRMLEGDVEGAIDALEVLARANPGDPGIQRQLAEAYRMIGNEEKAREHEARAEALESGR